MNASYIVLNQNNERKDASPYSPEEGIWRPVLGQTDGVKVRQIVSESSKATIKGRLGLSLSDLVVLRDNFELSTWLLLGACLQGLLLAMSPTKMYAILPAFLILIWRIIYIVLQCAGLVKNHRMTNIILGKFSVHSPDAEGKLIGETAQQGSMVVLFLNARCNHPLGMFASGFKEIADQLADMIKELEAEPEKYGYRTSTPWIGLGGDRTASQEILYIFYFNTLDGLHKFAHSPIHRIGWDHWNKTADKLDHISISHEIYVTKESEAVENIYINYHRAGYSAQNVKLADGSYVSPLVDASEGQYRTSKGRLNKVDHGKSNDRYLNYDYRYAAACPVMRQ